MLTFLTLFTIYQMVLGNQCQPLDCMITQHNGTTWVTSVPESCIIANPSGNMMEMMSQTFPCYRFNDSSLNGTFIADNCGLRYDCNPVPVPVSTNLKTEPFPVLIIAGTALAILFSMF